MTGRISITDVSVWSGDWVWGVPLVLLTVLIHASGLLLVSELVVERLAYRPNARVQRLRFAVAIGVSVLLATILHAVEAVARAVAYVELGAVANYRDAMLYSLSAMTSYGHANIFLAERWQMLGALEALNGMMLFGLTTAFLFSVVHRVSATGGFSGRK